MDGIHDMGGMDGFGSLPPDEPEAASPFHHEWEGPVEAMLWAGVAAGLFSLDRARHELELLDPSYYLRALYYERWLTGLESLFIEAGTVDREELRERAEAFAAGEAELADSPESEAEVDLNLLSGEGLDVEEGDPRFDVGDRVAVCKEHPKGHTRSPRYVRGVVGVVSDYRGAHPFADAAARGEERAEPLYNVRFDAADIWGEAHTDADAVRLEMWEPYLEPAEE